MNTIDLRSDTVTHPTLSMRQAMANAEVGDDGWGDDPTVNLLQRTVASMLDKESALFVPSGTMGNLASMLSHCNRGDEIIVGDQSHIYVNELAGASAIGGMAYRQLPNAEDGTIDLDIIESNIRPISPVLPRTSLVCLENTHNLCSGAVLSPEYVDAVSDIAHGAGAKVHLDGARIFNASTYMSLPPRELVKSVDSVMFCFSKGLCCPIGSIICGEEQFILNAKRTRKALGGSMRQVGVLAAAALVSLNEMVDRISEDHSNAKRLAMGLSVVPGVNLDPSKICTNIVNFEVHSVNVPDLLAGLKKKHILAGQVQKRNTVRMVTHYGIYEADIDRTIQEFRSTIMQIQNE